MPYLAPQVHDVTVDETRVISVDCTGKLDLTTSPVETMTGTPTITEVTTSVLTLGSKVISSASLTINGATVIAGHAVQFTCDASSATAGQAYTIKIVASTTAGQTIAGAVRIRVKAVV